jgi:protein SCO1/2
LLLATLFLVIGVACSGEAEEVAPLEESIGVTHPETAGFRVVTREELDPPRLAADIELTDQHGELFKLDDQRGKVVMIGFLYTNCPEACPLVAANFVQVRNQISSDPNADDLVQVLISTDPENDTQDRRKVYTRGIGGDWYFLGGETDEVSQVWDAYNVFRDVQERNVEVVVYHSYLTYLLDREGRIRYEHVGVWYPNDYTPDVQYLLSEG